MVDLVECEPPAFLVSKDVPPVEEERPDEPAHETLRQRHIPGG